MRTLFLGTSDDANERVPERLRAIHVASRKFEELTGIPVDVELRVVWPAPELPELVEGWLVRYEPDMVVVHVNPYWFTYRSVPARVGRLLGPLGRPVASAGLRLAASPKLSESAAFKAARRLALQTLGGDVAIGAEGCVAMLEQLIRRIVARENTVLMVQGPYRPNDASNTAAGYRRAAVACHAVNQGVEQICEQLHVTYWNRGVAPRAGLSDSLLGDSVHADAVEHFAVGHDEGEWMAAAWLHAHEAEQGD